MSSDLFEAFRNTLLAGGLWRPGESVLVAASGGADSTALLDLFHRLRGEADFPLTIAHLNHGLRGEEADGDEAFVMALADRMAVPCHRHRLPAGALQGADSGPEAAARRARRQFLHQTADRIGAGRGARGHTRDDQVETFLLRILRGSGRAGLGGMAPRSADRLIRPLLSFTRARIEAYLRDRGWSWRTDSSNADLSIPRNRVRHRLLPLLRAEFNPGVDSVLERSAAVLRDEEAYLDSATGELFRRLARRGEAGLSLSIPALRILPPALRRRLLREAAREATARADRMGPDFETVAGLEELVIRGRHQSARPLGPDLEARVLYSDLVLTGARLVPPLEREVPLPVPGEARLPELGVTVVARQMPAPADAGAPLPIRADRAIVDADSLPGALTVRSRRTGDSFRPLGAPGEARLKSYFIDRKVPRPARTRIPIVVAGGRIAWVVGYQIEDRFKVTPRTRRLLVLSKEMP